MNASIWEEVRAQMKAELPEHLFVSLFESFSFEMKDGNQVVLSFRDDFTKNGFEKKCLPSLNKILASLKQEQINVSLNSLAAEVPYDNGSQIDLPVTNKFDSKYSFENFVTGGSNQLAHAACHAISQNPGHCYNPLFIFGGAGLGKTHLLKAVGYELSKKSSDLKILLLTCESFTNELIQSVRIDKMREFREKYRTKCDVLLLDDIQFLAGKVRTQEEFFYTFNYLHESRKQIVVTSDRFPKDIEGLENRLQTRFEWGLVADVQPPEVETKIAILQNKADEQKITLPDNVAQFIAGFNTTNIRELEGALHRIAAYANLTHSQISLGLAQNIFKDSVPRLKHSITPDGLLKVLCLHFNIKIADLKSVNKSRKLSLPRQICMYLLRKLFALSYPEIGRLLGGRDHTTVLHGVNKIADLINSDALILSHIISIEGLIK